jgi:hypothetical protein
MMLLQQSNDLHKKPPSLQPNAKHDNLINTLYLYLEDKDIFYDDVNQIYNITYKKLIEKFPFQPLIEFCNKKNITLNNLVSFLDENESNKTSNKIGKVAIIFPLIYGMYNVEYFSKECSIGDYFYTIFYGYNWINHIEIKKRIEPKRISFIVCDMVKKNINKQFPNLLNVDFEEVIDDGTKLRYDIAISLSQEIIDEEYKNIIIIEIQEDNSNHILNPNDNIKNYVVNSKGHELLTHKIIYIIKSI